MPDPPTREKSELDLLREKNVKARDDFFVSLIKDDPDFEDVMKILTGGDKSATKKPKVIRKKTAKDPFFRASRSVIPLERRKSARLQNKEPELVDTETSKRKRSDDDDYADLEEVVYTPKIPKNRNTANKRSVRYILPVEDVTDEMIASIATRTSGKIYSELGTCCHQCRQKTMDQKTCCRNIDCIGMRGQICGICLDNRYGESAARALRDPNWHCLVCRAICNCSFCRIKAGKRPTGVLTPMAHQAGHRSVKDFLDSLNGVGDYPNQDKMPHKNRNPSPVPNDLLGFSSDGSAAYMDDTQHKFEASLNLQKIKDICQNEEKKLTLLEDEYDGCENLLGFYPNSNIALLENNIQYELQPLLPPISIEENVDEDMESPQINIEENVDVDMESPQINIEENVDVDMKSPQISIEENVDEDKEGQFPEFEIKTEMNNELLQETQATAASG